MKASCSLALLALFASACATTAPVQEESPQHVLYAPPETKTQEAPYVRIPVITRSTPKKTNSPTKLVINTDHIKRVRSIKKTRLSMDFHRVNLRDVFMLLAREGDVNIIADDDVKGTVTINAKGMRADKLFLNLMRTHKLGYEARGNVIRVAKKETLLAQLERSGD